MNGASGTLVKIVGLSSAYYSTMTLDPTTDVLYVSGERMLAALNGTNGNEIFQADPQTCGPFLDMGVNTSSNQLLEPGARCPPELRLPTRLRRHIWGIAYMYSFSGSIGAVTFNPSTNEIYVTGPEGLLALRGSASTGNVNSTLIGSYLNCLPV